MIHVLYHPSINYGHYLWDDEKLTLYFEHKGPLASGATRWKVHSHAPYTADMALSAGMVFQNPAAMDENMRLSEGF